MKLDNDLEKDVPQLLLSRYHFVLFLSYSFLFKMLKPFVQKHVNKNLLQPVKPRLYETKMFFFQHNLSSPHFFQGLLSVIHLLKTVL